MWHWRDWVIDAFNRNMPFDEFTVEQLAGDLLPHPTLAQRIATGFNRNHMINFEGGAIPEEYQNEYVVDRVETTSVVWLGMTMGCSRCHDHKYDPIKQKDFYRFYAFFNSISEKGLDGRKGNAQPVVQVPSPEQGREVVKVEQAICEHEAALPENPVLDEMQAAWEKTALTSLPAAPRDGLVAHYELDGNLADSSGHYRHGRIVKGDLGYDASRVGRAADFDGETQVDFGDTGGFERSEPVSIAFWMDPGERTEMPVMQKLDGEHRGWELFNQESEVLPRLRRGSRLEFRLIHHWPDDAMRVRTRDLIVTDAHAVTVTYDGSGKAGGVKMYMDGKAQDLEVITDALSGSITNSASLSIGDEKLGSPYRGSLDDLRIYNRVISPADAEELATHQPARATVAILPKKRSNSQKEELRDYYLTFAAAPDIRKIYGELKDLKREKEDLDWTVPDAMVMQEMDVARETAILGRGDYRNRGEVVTPGVPAVLPADGEGSARGPAGAGEVAGGSGASADGARGGEPLLADVFRHWHCEDGGGFRIAGRSAEPSRAAGLAGHRIHAHELGRESHAAADRDFGDLPAIVARDAGVARAGSGEPAAGARPAIPPAGGDGARQCTGGERAARRKASAARRVSVSAQGTVGGDRIWRRVLGANLCTGPRPGPLPAQHVHVLEAHQSAARR